MTFCRIIKPDIRVSDTVEPSKVKEQLREALNEGEDD